MLTPTSFCAVILCKLTCIWYDIMVAIHFLVHFKRGQCVCVCVMYMLTCMKAQVLVHMHLQRE